MKEFIVYVTLTALAACAAGYLIQHAYEKAQTDLLNPLKDKNHD